MKLTPYWLDSAERFAGGAEGKLEGEADAVVVGGGFAGLSAALALAQAGAGVVVLEAGRVVGEASGRNGGHVNNGTSVGFAGLATRLGTERARSIYQAYDAAVDTVERIVESEQITCDFRRCGKIKLAAKPAHFEAMAREYEALQRDADPETDLIPASRIREEIGSDQFHGGLVYRKSAQMHVGRFGAGLADAAARRGARIYEGAPVIAIDRAAGGAWRVATPRGSIAARQVLLATGASRQGPFFYFRRRVIPIGSFIIATEPLTAAQVDSIMPTRRNATTTKHIGNYFRIAPDNRLIFGGRARFALSDARSDAKSGTILEATLHAMFPQLGKPRIDYCWGGTIDLTADRLPRAGEHDGLYFAMGFSGHGVQMSVHMGQCMAAVMGGDATANPFRGLPWPAVPGHFGPPWFMPFVGAYYRLQDYFH
ncbi:MAG: FAD-binding oxidoreductase [Rhodospirillales bacterium]|nr:FAD-binding oxidoreductase [Rhodospirillales bacterium]